MRRQSRAGGRQSRAGASALAAGSLVLVGCAAGAGPTAAEQARHHGHVVLLDRNARPSAELDIATGATRIMVGTGRRGGPLVSARAPANSSVRPVLRGGRVIRVATAGTGRRGPADLKVLLSPSVRWRLVVGGGANVLRLNLGAARLRGLAILAGFDVISLRLPAPAGQVKVTLAGGASTVLIRIPVPVRARLVLAGGAGSATVANRSYSGLAGGTVLRAPGRPGATSRYLIDATAGLASVTVTQVPRR